MLKFLSICSGIEAASVAFAPLGWEALAFAEIEPFPCAVLAHHYPHIPNLGDLTQWRTWPASLLVQVQILCGGTPCQAFSVAGLRASLGDERGNLSLIFCELYAHINTLRRAAGLSPALLLWENVPGVLSTHDNAFGCFLAGIAGEVDALQPPGGKWAHAGYVSGPSAAIAYRTLDAQYFGLAQRRKRVFVVASADPAFDPATVLFELTGLRRDTPPRREAGQNTAPTLSARAQGGGGLGTDADADCDGACIPEKVESQAHPHIVGTLRSTDGGPDVNHAREHHLIATAAETGAGFWTDDGLARLRVTTAPTQPQTIVAACAGTLNANGKAAGSATQQDADQGLLIPTLANCLTRRMDKGLNTTLDEGQTPIVEVTHSLRAEGFDASKDGTGRGTPLVAIAFSARMRGDDGRGYDRPPLVFGDVAGTLDTVKPHCVAFSAKDHGADATADLAPIMRAGNHNTSHPNSGNWLAVAFPERLSGTQCASAEDLSPVLQSHNPTAVAFAIQERAVSENPHAGPDGVGIRSDNCAYTLEARQVPQAVAFQPRIARNGRDNTGDVVNALQAQSGQSGKGDAAPCVAVKEPESFTCKGFRHKQSDASAQETHAIKTLRTLLQEVGEETFTQWGLGVLDTLQSAAVLQYDMLGEASRLTWASRWEILVNYPLPCAQTSPGRNMRDLWKNQSKRCSSSGPQSSKQRSGKPPESLQELSYEIPSQSSILFCLWEACEGIEVLRKALSAFQKMGGPVSNENQSAYPTWKVRRLTPEEAEILQGFPIGYTLIPGYSSKSRKGEDIDQTITYLQSILPEVDAGQLAMLAHSPDGPRYKALGNSWAVPCARWIAQRISHHLSQ